MPFADIDVEKQTAISKCRDAAAELIADIASNWRGSKPCQMSGWNATWLIYQASLVPLLSLFSDAVDSVVVNRSRPQVEVVMGALEEMKGWSLTAQRSLEVVSKIFEASKRFAIRSLQVEQENEANTSRFYDPVHPSRSMMPESAGLNANNVDSDLVMDSMWDSLNWSTGWESMLFPYETTSPDWEYGPVTGWSEEMGSAGFPFQPMFQGGQGQTHGTNGTNQHQFQQ